MPTLLEYVFSYILGAVLLFQGLHLFQETRSPLGTLPEEVQQETSSSRKWGIVLLAWSVIALGTGLLSHAYPWFASLVVPFFILGGVILAVFSAWVVFAGRTIEFMGKPSVDEHHDPAADPSHH